MENFLNLAAMMGVLIFVGATLIMRTWINFRRTRKNAMVLRFDDDAYGFIGRAFAVCIGLVLFVTVGCALWPAVMWEMGPIQRLMSPGIRIAGLVLSAISLLIVLIAQKHMGDSWRIGIDQRETTALVITGIFRYSRNPIFLGMRLALLGLFLSLPIAPMLGIWLLGDTIMQIQVRLEEQHLLRMHEDAYRAYKQQVPRWI